MTPNDKQLTRAIYSFWDFQQALSAITFLREECEFQEKYDNVTLRRFRCYETTLIISLVRPFEKTRKGTTISLKSMGIKLNSGEKKIIDRVMHLRRKIIAHSDEEEMHFRSSMFSVLGGDFNVPHLQFNEGLNLEEKELKDLETFLRKLSNKIYSFLFKNFQEKPKVLEKYREPDSFKSNKKGNA